MEIMYDSKMGDVNHMVNQVNHVVPYVSTPQSRVGCLPQLKHQPKFKAQS